MRTAIISTLFVTLLASPALGSENAVPWWKQQKIRFMWGTWPHVDKHFRGSLYYWSSDLPREFFRNIAQAGATVFTEVRGYKPEHARFAHGFGLKYFATLYPAYLHHGHGHGVHLAGGRRTITAAGELVPEEGGRPVTCPLDESVHEKWLLVGGFRDVPILKGVQDALIDGIHTDWETYHPIICYCDACFAAFLARQRIEEALPEKTKRFPWLGERNLVDAYKQTFSKRWIEMFTRIRGKLHAAKPDLLFSAYGPVISDFTVAMNTPETPFIFLDARHYYNDDRQPWWESYSHPLRQEGYLYICGGWTNSLFGAQASQVSAARWIYEASINEDGCWLWFEHELDDEILRAYAAADRQIKAVQGKLGKYLFHGQRDPHFVTAVEWTGRPALERALIHQTYHSGDEHLTHINNVNTAWPMRARIRFPRLAQGRHWTMGDPMGEHHYTRDGKTAVWTSDDLRKGVVVAMEPRSDLFLLVTPAGKSLHVDRSRLMHSREFDTLPGHAAAAAQAGPVKAKAFRLPKDGWQFKMDEKDLGVEAKWFLPTAPLVGWIPIEIERFWGGKGGLGAGWYRGDVNIPALPESERTYLNFGAVDEELMLWIDGQFVGQHDLGPDGWDKPFAIDVTGKLTTGKHHLAMRVYNSARAGGVWKPISIVADSDADVTTDAVATAASNRLVYTATEHPATDQLGFRQTTGALVIRNTIHTTAVDGANETRVRQLNGHLWSPRYSPDGRRIAFVHDAGGRGQIHVMNADGSGATNVSNNTFCDRSPVWSPDGKSIAFMSDRTSDWDIHVMADDGTNLRCLAANPDRDRAPAWSPDSKTLAWESHGSGMPQIWVGDADGQNSRPLIAANKPLTVQFRQAGEDQLFNVEVDSAFADNKFYLTDPVWSPDGQSIAAVGLGRNGGKMVVAIDVDGSRMLQVIRWLPGVNDLTWSPDGTHLAGMLSTAPQETERSGIFAVKADGTEAYRWLVDATPRGPRLGGAQRRNLMTWYTHGSARPRRVVKTFTSLAWSPDSTSLAFSSDIDPSGAFYVYTIRLAEGEPRRLDGSKSAWPNEIMWRPQRSQ